MRETERASKIVHEIRFVHKLFCINLAGSKFQMPGLPDILFIKNKIHYWIEFKEEDKECSGVQYSVHRQMFQQGIHVYVVRFFGSDHWVIDDLFHVREKTFKQMVQSLVSILEEDAHKDQKGGAVVPMVT